ncbi:MAG: 2-dehydro-3-deoxy-6-phosphogalactonate aldolase [Alphaproteobacteria bacterium]
MSALREALARCPLVAILRGIAPDEAVPVARALHEAGFAVVEVPLNSPEPFDSIARIVAALGDEMLVGAGTVMTPAEVERIAAAGGRLIVMPHFDTEVVAAAKGRGLACAPGVATPSEAFAALKAGADALKLFPAQALPPSVLSAWGAVLPAGTLTMPVGGVHAGNLAAYWDAGARGFGIGSNLYKPGKSVAEVAATAAELVDAIRSLG